MKTIKQPHKTVIATIALALILAAKPWAGNLTVSFGNQNGSTQDCKILYTTNLSLPTNQWPMLAVVSNCPPNSTSNFFIWSNPPPADYFFTCAWTNSFWKVQSFFSAAASTPPLATNPVSSLQLISQ